MVGRELDIASGKHAQGKAVDDRCAHHGQHSGGVSDHCLNDERAAETQLPRQGVKAGNLDEIESNQDDVDPAIEYSARIHLPKNPDKVLAGNLRVDESKGACED